MSASPGTPDPFQQRCVLLADVLAEAQEALQLALPLVEQHEPCGYYCSEEHGHMDHPIEAKIDAAMESIRRVLAGEAS